MAKPAAKPAKPVATKPVPAVKPAAPAAVVVAPAAQPVASAFASIPVVVKATAKKVVLNPTAAWPFPSGTRP